VQLRRPGGLLHNCRQARDVEKDCDFSIIARLS
jgi:hypothetical protein